MWYFKHSLDTAGTSEITQGRQCSIWTGGGCSKVRYSPTPSKQCHGTVWWLLMSMEMTEVNTMQRIEMWGLWPSPSYSSAPGFWGSDAFLCSSGLRMPTSKFRQTTAVIYPRSVILRLLCEFECCFNLNGYFHHRSLVCNMRIKMEKLVQMSRCLNSLGRSMHSLRILGT